MKHVAIFFSHGDPEGPPFDNAGYRAAYRQLAQQISDHGALCTFVRSAESFLGSGTFSHGWRFASDESQERIEGPLHADVVYNKGEDFAADDETRMVNPPTLDALCRNKDQTYEQFSRFMPRTVRINGGTELRGQLAGLPRELLTVIKPLNRWGGVGIIIASPEHIDPDVLEYPVILQEFVDTSGGIPELCEGRHDLRCAIVNGAIVMGSVRTPPRGTLMANVAQGAELRPIAPERIPEEPLRIACDVDHTLEHFGTRIYSVDFGRDISNRWYVFELNPQPGLTAPHWGPQTGLLYAAVADALVEAAS